MTEITEFVDAMDAKATDEYGTLADDERVEITVEYETDAGNTRTRTGTVWAVDEGRFGTTKLRFSADIGDDEDPYYVEVRNGSATLVSVAETRETDLGDVTDFDAPDVTEENEDDDVDPLAAFEEPEDIEEGMELTDGSGDVFLIKDVCDERTNVAIWNDGRLKRRQSFNTETLRQDYQTGELQVV
jgi:hypothetical protein